jgi:hypothetical protein
LHPRWCPPRPAIGLTDRRDAEKPARCHRAGDLTAVWVPDEAHEALRDLIRAREAAKKDQLRARHWLGKFLLRHGRRPAAKITPWTAKPVDWIKSQGPSINRPRRLRCWTTCRKWIMPSRASAAWKSLLTSWSYQFRPWVGGFLLKRRQGLPDDIKEIAWKAQHRLHSRYKKLAAAGKNKPQIVTAIGREPPGFIWAIGVKTETRPQAQAPAA